MTRTYPLGELDDAFVWLDRAIDCRDDMIIPLASYPFLDPIRTDRRYVALMRELRYDPSGRGVCRSPIADPADVSDRKPAKAL